MALPNQVNAQAASGSQWSVTYTLTNDDGSVMAITGKTFEFVVRPSVTDTTEPAEVSVNSTAANAQGSMTVNTAAGTVQVVLNPAATQLLATSGGGPYSLWMDPGLPDATCLVTGTFYVQQVPAA